MRPWMQNPGPHDSRAKSVRTVNLLHMPRPRHKQHRHRVSPQSVSTSIYGGVHLHQTRQRRLLTVVFVHLCPFGRAVRSSSTRERGPTFDTCSSSSLQYTCWYNFFSRAALNLFAYPNQSTPTLLAHNIPFGSFQVPILFWKGLRHAQERSSSVQQ